jgi:very-short-patch-repair endonuclease
MFTGVFKDRTRSTSQRSAAETLAHVLRAKSLRPHRFLRGSEVGPFTVEHVCHDRKLIVELRKIALDESRQQARIAFLKEMGYRVLQISRQAVLAHPDKVIALVRDALSGR